MTMPSSPIWAFAVRLFLWLPPCFAFWYGISTWHTHVIARLGWQFIDIYKSGIVSSLEFGDRLITFVTTIKVHPSPGTTAMLLPEVNPLVYSYGLSLFLALALASKAQWWKVLVGALILLPFQAWGIAFDLLTQVGIKLTNDIAAQAGLLDWRRDFAVLAYQMGLLIFPTIVPVLVWAAMEKRAVESMIGRCFNFRGDALADLNVKYGKAEFSSLPILADKDVANQLPPKKQVFGRM